VISYKTKHNSNTKYKTLKLLAIKEVEKSHIMYRRRLLVMDYRMENRKSHSSSFLTKGTAPILLIENIPDKSPSRIKKYPT